MLNVRIKPPNILLLHPNQCDLNKEIETQAAAFSAPSGIPRAAVEEARSILPNREPPCDLRETAHPLCVQFFTSTGSPKNRVTLLKLLGVATGVFSVKGCVVTVTKFQARLSQWELLLARVVLVHALIGIPKTKQEELGRRKKDSLSAHGLSLLPSMAILSHQP